MHHLVDHAKDDTLPPLRHVGPSGGELSTSAGQTDIQRRGALVDRQAKYGQLLACLVADGQPNPGVENPRPQGVTVIGAEGEMENSGSQPVKLWLVVNDSVIDPNQLEVSKVLYLPPTDKGSCPELERRWKYIVEHRYWDVWFDDNVGSYVVTIEQGNR